MIIKDKPHNLYLSFLIASLGWRLRLIQAQPNLTFKDHDCQYDTCEVGVQFDPMVPQGPENSKEKVTNINGR